MTDSTPKTPQITVHPAAAIFPMMSDDELAEMARSIDKNGLREKIHAIVHVSDDQTTWEVLDGRNRLEALRRYLKVDTATLIASYMTPITLGLAYSPEEYVMMANIERRNLTGAQRKELAGKLAIMLGERQKHLPKEEQKDTIQAAADAAGVSRRTAASAKKEQIAAKAPEKTPAKASAKKPEPKYVPLKPKNAIGISENVYKTLSHEENVEVGGKKTKQLYLDGWTIEELREMSQIVKAMDGLIESYLPIRIDREKKKVQEQLDAMNKATA